MKTPILFLIVTLTLGSAAFGQTKNDTAKRVEQTNELLVPVEDYAKMIEDYVNASGGPDIIITDVSEYNDAEEPEWIKFESFDEYEADQRSSYTTAFIWKKDGNIVQVNCTYSSPSGDWAQYVSYTFFPDGTAAKIDRELRTFMGDIIVNRIFLYDEKGDLIKQSKTFRDLATLETVKEPESFEDIDVDIHKKLSELPFIGLLAPPAADKDVKISANQV